MKIDLTSRHSGRLAPIFYFNCEHFLFVKKSLRIHKFNKNRILFVADFFEILIIHKSSLRSCIVPVQPFRNKHPVQTEKQFIYTRLAPIFYINCEHVLLVYIVKQKQNKISWIFKIFKNRNLLEANF